MRGHVSRVATVFAAFSGICGGAGMASAATVSPVSGDVLISQGQGFQKIDRPTDIPAGAKIMVGPRASATIAYADDCVVPLNSAGVTVVRSWSPCKALPEPMRFTPRVGEERKTSAEAPPPAPPPAPSGSSAPKNSSAKQSDDDDPFGTYLIVGGVAVGAGVLAGVLASQSDDDPVSP